MPQHTLRTPLIGHAYTTRGHTVSLYANPGELRSFAKLQPNEVVMVVDYVNHNCKVLTSDGIICFIHVLIFSEYMISLPGMDGSK